MAEGILIEKNRSSLDLLLANSLKIKVRMTVPSSRKDAEVFVAHRTLVGTVPIGLPGIRFVSVKRFEEPLGCGQRSRLFV